MKNNQVTESTKARKRLPRIEAALRIKRAHKQGKMFLTTEGMQRIGSPESHFLD